jgi:hypothetical protein
MRTSAVLAATGITLAASGCYTTTQVPLTRIATIDHTMAAPTDLSGTARLGPSTEIRARLADGSVTTWYTAGDVAVGTDGLVTGRRYALSSANEVVLSGVGGVAADMLAATAPPGGEVTPLGDGGLQLRLRVKDNRFLLPWLAAYANGAAALRQPAGTLRFQAHGRNAWRSADVPGDSFARLPPQQLADVQLAEGIPWRDVAGLELHNLNPIDTAFAVVGVPIAGALMAVAMIATAGAIANGDDPTPGLQLGAAVASVTADAAGSADAGADTGGAPVLGPSHHPAVLVAGGGATAGTLRTTPLFTGEAVRRDMIKFLVAGEGGVTSDSTFAGALGVGLRLSDFVELSARARVVTFDEGSGPYGGPSPGSPHLLYGGRLALHIDPDGDPLLAFVAGGEVVGNTIGDYGSLTQAAFVFGPRFGIGQKAFASLLLEPSLIVWSGLPNRPDGSAGQLTINLEVGFGL